MSFSCCKKLFCFSIILTVISVIVLIFAIFIFNILIKSEAKDSAILTEENADLWGDIPGRSKVQIVRDHFFYNLENFGDLFNGVSTAVTSEIGPYRVNEFQKFINRTFSDNGNIVDYNYFRYFKDANESVYPLTDQVTTINLPAIGVWHQLKNLPREKAALQALYTIVTGFSTDLYWQVCHQMLTQTNPNLQTFNASITSELSYLGDQVITKIYSDDYVGFITENGVLVKAAVNHPCSESKYIADYFRLSGFDMELLKIAFTKIVDKTSPLAFPQLEGGLTPSNTMAYQWKNLSVALNDTVYNLNQTFPGPVEYGGFLRYYYPGINSNLTIDKIKKILAYNDFEGIDPKTKKIKNKVLVDDSTSLLNKKNIDDIFNQASENKSIEFLNNVLQLNDTTEATYLFKYLDYLGGEMAFQYSFGGTRGIGGMSQMVNQFFVQMFNELGFSLFFNYIKLSSFDDYFEKTPCKDALGQNFYPEANLDVICSQLDTQNMENLLTWIEGVLFSKESFRQLLNCTEIQFLYVVSDNSQIKTQLMKYVNPFMTKFKDFIDGTNYKSANFLRLAGAQWVNSYVTQNFQVLKYTDNSISSKYWDSKNFPASPEYSVYCKKANLTNDFTLEIINPVLNYDYLLSSKFVQFSLINNHRGNKNIFSSDTFVGYMKNAFMNTVLGGMIVKRSISDLLYGYEDPFLKMISQLNYYTGGDPTVNPFFSLLMNMTKVPEDKNDKWSLFTGKNDSNLIRQYRSILGFNRSEIVFKDVYFDGKELMPIYINPWNNSWVELNGTDMISVKPDMKDNDEIWGYLDDLYRSARFNHTDHVTYNDLKAKRLILSKDAIANTTVNPSNAVYFARLYNNLSNQTSVFKAPMWASKPYYYQCDNIGDALPVITRAKSVTNKTEPEEMAVLFNESFVDVEVYSGAVLRATQKLLISVLIEPDELFNVKTDRFVPIYYTFRSGNFTNESIDVVFSQLTGALNIKFIILIISIVLTVLSIGILIFSYIKTQKEKKKANTAVNYDSGSVSASGSGGDYVSVSSNEKKN